MRKVIFALLLFVGLGAGAQVVKYATEVAPLSGDEVERSTVWDFSGRALVRDDGQGYVFVDEVIVYESFGGSCRAYAVVGDSLFFRGYNVGRSERMNVTEGEEFAKEETEDGYDDETMMRVLDGALAEVTDGTVRVIFPAGSDAFDVDIYLLDVPGFLYAHRTANTADDFPSVFETASLKHGQYIVAVHLHENPELNRKILVVL